MVNCTPTHQKDGDKNKSHKDNDDDKITSVEIAPHNWVGKTYKVAKAEEEGKLVEYNAEKQPTFSFQEEKANIKLSVNGCFGSYEANEYTIKINNEGCTEKCCDSDDDRFLLKLLRMNTFNFGQFGKYTILMNGDNKVWLVVNE
jgi:heat shock protein HslJ